MSKEAHQFISSDVMFETSPGGKDVCGYKVPGNAGDRCQSLNRWLIGAPITILLRLEKRSDHTVRLVLTR